MKKPIIALAQIKYFDKDSSNLEKIKKYIALAKKKNADIVCFPESCLRKIHTLKFDDKIIKEIQKECKKNSIWAIITEDIVYKKKPYNLAILIDRQGKVKGNYKKIYLYGDNEKLNSGKKTRVFKTDFGKIGIAICWDIAFPKLFEKMKKAGAEIVFCPSQWCYEEKAHENKHKKRELEILRSIIKTRAFENIFFVAVINPVRPYEPEQIAYSAISSPHKILSEIIDKEGLVTSEINLSEIKKFRQLYPGKK